MKTDWFRLVVIAWLLALTLAEIGTRMDLVALATATTNVATANARNWDALAGKHDAE